MKRAQEFGPSEGESQGKLRKFDGPTSNSSSSSLELSTNGNTGPLMMMGGVASSYRNSSNLSSNTSSSINSFSSSPTPSQSSVLHNSNSNDGSESTQEKVSKQKHAMDFLYKVRDQYSNNPNTYNEFLEIMKGFKSGSIETSEVIHRVKELFKGNEYLIEEFNLFLPPGFKIESEVTPSSSASSSSSSSAVVGSQGSTSTGTGSGSGLGLGNPSSSTSLPSSSEPSPNVAQGDLEQARNYVRKIKNRFAMQPQIYKTFLEILHGYYQGQHAIGDVLSEVADLFQNHTDLLVEFQHFLPKSGGHINARGGGSSGGGSGGGSSSSSGGGLLPANAPASLSTSAPSAFNKKQKKKLKEKPEKFVGERMVERFDKPSPSESSHGGSHLSVAHQSIASTSLSAPVLPKRKEEKKLPALSLEDKKRAKKEEKKKDAKYQPPVATPSIMEKKEPAIERMVPPALPPTVIPTFVPNLSRASSNTESSSYSEFNYYREVKQRLKSKYLYHQFLSAISMFSQGVITKAELMYLTHGILIKHRELYDSFKTFIGFHENDESFGDPVTQISQLGDDLRELNIVLNEIHTTIGMLESVMEKYKQENVPITLTNLDVNYIQQIEKMYGNRGPELLEALFQDPTTVTPIILKRLKQKHREWEELRNIVRRRAKEQEHTETFAT